MDLCYNHYNEALMINKYSADEWARCIMKIHLIPSSMERSILLKADDEDKRKIAQRDEAFKKKIHDEYKGLVFYFMKKPSGWQNGRALTRTDKALL